MEFIAQLGVPLDKRLKNGYLIESHDMREAMIRWFNDIESRPFCISMKPHNSEAITRQTRCADVIDLDPQTFILRAKLADNIPGMHFKEQYDEYRIPVVQYLPLGIGFNKTDKQIRNLDITAAYLFLTDI